MSIVCRRISVLFNYECHTRYIRVETGFLKVSDVSEQCIPRNIMLRLLIFLVSNVKGNIGLTAFHF